MPDSIGKNGYRYYTDKELERLQQIMFYRELDFSLGQIKIALENEPNRLICLEQQRILLIERKERLTKILDTLDETISHAQKGAAMSAEKMFSGFDKEEWAEALQEQNDHLQKEYGYSIPSHEIDVAAMNEKAEEATRFMAFMARSLREGVAAHADIVQAAIREHIVFLQRDTEIDAASFATQSRFFLSDDFHRSMMESQQVGLSYYVCIAADHFTTTEKKMRFCAGPSDVLPSHGMSGATDRPSERRDSQAFRAKRGERPQPKATRLATWGLFTFSRSRKNEPR